MVVGLRPKAANGLKVVVVIGAALGGLYCLVGVVWTRPLRLALVYLELDILLEWFRC